MKNAMKRTSSKPATLAVDYTPEFARVIEMARKAGAAKQRADKRQDSEILPMCVEATREAMHVGLLVDGRTKDAAEGTKTGKDFAGYFGTTSSEVTFWKRLALYLDAGGSVGDALWLRLGTKRGEGKKTYLAKKADVAAVIEGGGSLADIAAACDAVEKAAPSRAARPASESEGESPEKGIVPSDDPVADALLSILSLSAACKRIPKGDPGWTKVAAELAKVVKRESTLRPASARTRKAAAPVEDLAPAM